MKNYNVIILPGNGNTDISENWYPWLQTELEKFGVEVRAKNMPDPDVARMEIWLPFIERELKADGSSILIGHSSGAVAATRYAESHQVKGIILIGTCYTDLNNEKEKQSHYYDTPWQWDKIRKNAERIAIFASVDDPYISINEPRFIHKNLGGEYFEYENRGHFMKKTFPELIDVVKKWIK